MKVHLARSAGFCFGVQRALNIALENSKNKEKIYVLGDIVHNDETVEQIKRLGIKKIDRLDKSGKGKILLIRAHGTSLKIIDKAERLGYSIIDATCPMVKEIHRMVTMMEKKGLRIIIIGDKQHDEVIGIMGQLKQRAVIINDIKSVYQEALKKISRACVIAQSTQNLDKVIEIVEALKRLIPKVKFFNTICRPTLIKQEEIKSLSKQNDAVVVIGSKGSANTKRLYEISKSLNPKTYWLSSKKEIELLWFKGVRTVGVTAGASTPKSTIKEITKCLSRL